jgi:hypothetical protein
MSTGELASSTGGASRSNRRRRRDPISSASSEKENNLGDDFACLSLESRKMDRNGTSTSTSSKSKSESSRKDVIAIFRVAAASTSEAKFWKKHTQLMECVVDASMMSMSPSSMGKEKRDPHADDGITGTLLLEEHALDLLNGCRKVLKEAKESKDIAGTLACLCVGVHGLRAICARTTKITGGSKQDAAVKLLFHAIVTAEDITARMDTKVDALEMQRAACYSLAAYEALGKLLKLYSVQTQTCSKRSAGTGVVIFTMDPKQENDPLDMAGVFPIPTTKTSVEEQVPAGSLSIDLVCSIGIQSTIAASRILTRLSPIMKQKILGSPPVAEFNGILVESILEQKNSSPVIPIAVHLIRRNLLPWILFLASHSEQDCTKQVTSHGRDAHRILWDAASSMAQSKEDGDAQECLLLRGNAVAALLLGGDTGLRQLSSRLRSALLQKHFDNACTYAWKAAVSYCQLAAPFTTSSAPCPDPLRRYHEEIGRILDAFAVEDSLAYTEYCAYRAFHVGLTTSSSSACISSDRCLFAPIPLQYPHSDCGSDSDMAAVSMSSGNQAFLAAFFLSVYVRDRLRKIDKVAAGGDDTVPADFIRNSLAIMARMRSTIIESDNSAAVSNRLRYFSMLSMISLHRVVFDVVERGDSLPLHGSVPVMVQLAADILVSCVGPLGRTVVISDSKSMEEIRVRQTWTSLVECFVRGISAFEMLSSKLVSTDENTYTSANYPLERANSAMNDLADTLDRKRGRLKAPRDTAENAAKVRYVNAKSYSLVGCAVAWTAGTHFCSLL